MKIYHNPRCGKSRETLAIIREQGVEPEIVEYLKAVPSKQEMKDLLMKLNLKPSDLLRKGEAVFKEKFKGKNFEEEEWLQIMLEHPKLIERPIVVRGNKAIVGRPPEKVMELM
tara:strand:- start:204 stop:542 length:339 start_codon:yes stop_codon:yes gene_type:complete